MLDPALFCVVTLRAICYDLGQPVSGVRPVLIERLRHIMSEPDVVSEGPPVEAVVLQPPPAAACHLVNTTSLLSLFVLFTYRNYFAQC